MANSVYCHCSRGARRECSSSAVESPEKAFLDGDNIRRYQHPLMMCNPKVGIDITIDSISG